MHGRLQRLSTQRGRPSELRSSRPRRPLDLATALLPTRSSHPFYLDPRVHARHMTRRGSLPPPIGPCTPYVHYAERSLRTLACCTGATRSDSLPARSPDPRAASRSSTAGHRRYPDECVTVAPHLTEAPLNIVTKATSRPEDAGSVGEAGHHQRFRATSRPHRHCVRRRFPLAARTSPTNSRQVTRGLRSNTGLSASLLQASLAVH